MQMPVLNQQHWHRRWPIKHNSDSHTLHTQTHTIHVSLWILIFICTDIAGYSRHNQTEGKGSKISKQPWGLWPHCKHFVPPLHGLFISLIFILCSWLFQPLHTSLSRNLICVIVLSILFCWYCKALGKTLTHRHTRSRERKFHNVASIMAY